MQTARHLHAVDGTNHTRADIVAFIPRALAFVESQGGYADAELVDRELGEKGVAALLIAATTGERVEALGGFLIRKGERS